MDFSAKLVSRETYKHQIRAQRSGSNLERKKNGMSELSTGSVSLTAEANDMKFLLTTGQANKSARGMPWHQEPKKDVISCEKPRGAANKLRSGDVRMGKPT